MNPQEQMNIPGAQAPAQSVPGAVPNAQQQGQPALPGSAPVIPTPPSAPVSQKDKDKETQEVVTFTRSDVDFETAKRMYLDAKKYVDITLRTRWDNYFKVYQGERVDPSYFGTITVNNREVHSIIETLVANIAGGLPSFHFIPTNPDQQVDTTLINNILDYYMEYNGMDLKNQMWVRDMLMYGTGILHAAWREGKAYIENIPLRDFFVDPTSTGLTNTQTPARYAGFEYLASKDTLEATMIFDEDSGEMKAKYDLTDIGDFPIANGDTKATDKQFKNLFNGTTLDQADAVIKQVHMVLIHDIVSGKTMEIANQKKFAYYADSVLQREAETRKVMKAINNQQVEVTQNLDQIVPFLPFASIVDYADSSLFYGEGEMSLLLGDSELLNDYEAMDADNTAYQNAPAYTIDPQFSDMAVEIETISGAVYPLPKGALSALEIPQLSEGLDLKKNAIIERMRSGTAADEAVQGISQSQGRITATEVQTQLTQAQGRFTTKLTNLASGGYKQLGSIIFKMMQIFLTADQAIRIIGKEGISFQYFDAWDWNGEMEPQVKLDTQIKQAQVEKGMKDQMLFQSLDQDRQIFDPVKYARWKAQRIDPNLTDEDFNDLLAPPVPPQPPEVRDFVQLDKIFVAAGPITKQNILKEIGLPADPSLDAEAQQQQITIAAQNADLLDPSTDANGKVLPMIDAANKVTPQVAPVAAMAA